MRDVLLIDTRNRTVHRHAACGSLHAREYNIFIAGTERKALDMLRTAVMDAVIINSSGTEEAAPDLVGQIALDHPGIEIMFLSAQEVDRFVEKHSRFRC